MIARGRGSFRAAISVLFLFAIAAESGAASGGAATAAAPARLAWEKDYKSAQTKARAAGKIVMVDFWASWCHYCEKLDKTTYSDPTVVARLQKTAIPVKVNTEGRRDEMEFADEHGVEGLPTIGFFTAEGHAVGRIDGYADSAAFLKMLSTVEAEAADMMGWEKTLKTDPKNFAALLGLGGKLYELNYQREARPLLEAARRNDNGPLKDRKRARMMLARIIEEETSLTDSEVMLREALALPPESEIDPRIEFLLSRCLAGLGRTADAKAELRKLIAAYPNHAITATAKKTLSDLK